MADSRNSRRLRAKMAAKLDRLETIAAYSDAEQRVNVEILKLLAEKVGLTSIEGMPFERYFAHLREKKLKEVLLLLEEANPSLAAKVQQMMDDASEGRRSK
jgi:hypothetical protein